MTTFCCSFKSFKAWLSSLYICLLIWSFCSFLSSFLFMHISNSPPCFFVIACGIDFCYSSLHFPEKGFSICISSICFLVNVVGNVNYSHLFLNLEFINLLYSLQACDNVIWNCKDSVLVNKRKYPNSKRLVYKENKF